MKWFNSLLCFFAISLLTACPKGQEVAPVDVTSSPAPTTTSGGDLISGTFPATATVGTLYEYTPSASASGVVFSIQNKPDWATFTTGTGTLSGIPNIAASFPDIKVTGTLGDSSTTLTFAIVVSGAGDAFSGDYPTTAMTGSAYDFTPTSLVTGVTYSIQNKPAWASFNTATGRLSGTPTAAATHSAIKITGLVGIKSNQTIFNLIVSLNSPGTVMSGSYPTTASEDLLYEYTPTTLMSGTTFAIQNKPAWASFDTATGKLSGHPTPAGVFSNITVTASSGGVASMETFAITVAGDPLSSSAWHLHNEGQKTFATKNAKAGEDMNVREALRLGYTGKGVRVAVTDSGLEIAHEDMSANVLAGESRDYVNNLVSPYNGDPTNTTDTQGDHGTSVSGIIAARGWNGKGARGIAPSAGIVGMNFLNPAVSAAIYDISVLDQLDGNFDVFNQSWGSYFGTQSSSLAYYNPSAADSCYVKALKHGVETSRSGKGAIYVRAAGNEFEFDDSTFSASGHYLSIPANLDAINAQPYTITVGAMNSQGKKSSYSTSGSALWIAGLGGEYGVGTPAILTTDQSSCAKGMSPYTAIYYQGLVSGLNLSFDNGGSALNPSCNYTALMNGTSAAAPSISGVVALMLEANSSLGWRDVKHILATTATKVDASFAPVTRSIDATGYVYEDGWTTNAAGFHFHNWYGFGRANAEDAVTLAKTYTPMASALTQTNWAADSGAITLAIPDNNKNGVSSTLSVAQSLVVEAVQIQISTSHGRAGDLAIELYSPSGTKSIVMNGRNGVRAGSGFAYGNYSTSSSFDPRTLTSCGANPSGAVMLSNAFYGETSTGTWTLKVIDLRSGTSGTVTNWKLNIFGHAP